MQSKAPIPPRLSYVLAATDSVELARVVTWLRQRRMSPDIEIVVAASASDLARTAGRLVPPWVRLAGAIKPADRKAVRVVGARASTGSVVIVVDCNDDFSSRIGDPFGSGTGVDENDPAEVILDNPGVQTGWPALPPGLGARRAISAGPTGA